MSMKLTGLVAAAHTPFDGEARLNTSVVEKQAEHLARKGVSGVFIAGTTGESHSLTVEERLALAERWAAVCKGTSLKLIVHVGANCLPDARTLAAQAQKLGVTAIAALSPSYFAPKSVEALVECCAMVASAAPGVPFYFYDIPTMTNVRLSMPDFLDAAAARIPTLAGLKFTNSDLMSFQRCLHSQGGRFDVLWGFDEFLLAALALGARGAVGSTYNLAAPLYLRVLAALEKGDLATARQEQYRSVQLITALIEYGFIGAAKAVMEMQGVPVGPARLPNASLTPKQAEELRAALTRMGFFEWV